METSLLTTKLNIPPARPQLVPRPRLIKKLQEGLHYNLMLVAAPAGFGKTTLLSEWVRQNQPPIRTAWVSLDEGDNDPVRFWDYFIAAVRTLQLAVGENTLKILRASRALPGEVPPIESVLIPLINDLAGVKGDYLVVLDDYHFINSQQIHDGITYLLEHMPAQMHLVIASRAAPLLPLARLRVRGKMLEIGADDLRFTMEDTASLLREMKAPELSMDDIVALNQRTEGWVAGLIMAVFSLSGHKDISGFIASFTGSQRYVMDYLMEEVLHKQTAEMCEFLLKTSVLERLSGPLCDVVTGRSDCQDILLSLESAKLFITPLDDSRKWYRYEHLFADLLRHQCETAYGTERIADLRRQACQWYEENNLHDDAIHQALAAEDWEKSISLITEHGNKKRLNGEFVTLANWLRALPEEVIVSHPEVYRLFFPAVITAGNLDITESILKTLEEADQGDDSIRGEIATQQAMVAYRRYNYPLAEELARKALLVLPPDLLEARGAMNTVLGVMNYNKGNFKEAELHLTESYEILQQTGEDFGASAALSGLINIVYQKGELRHAAEMTQQAIEIYEASPASAVHHILLSSIFYEWNDLEAVVNHVQQVIELGQLIGVLHSRVYLYDTLALYRLAYGDKIESMKALEKADFEAHNIGEMPSLQAQHAAYHIQIALRQDDLTAAEKWNSKLAKYADSIPYDLRYIPLRLPIAQGRKSEAMEILQIVYDDAAESGMQRLMIVCCIYQAMAAETEESAVEFLSEALTMAEPEGFIRTFVDEGKLLKPLLEKALSKGITPEYTRKLLTIIEAEERQRRKMKKGERVPSPYHALLSERELEVLRLMADGLSNQQIANRLIISLSTAKNHVHNLLEKLNVKGRTQAIVQAKELELI